MHGHLKETVRKKYGEAAERVARGALGACCGSSCGCGGEGTSLDAADPVTRDLYDSVTASSLPEKAVLASLGCGNPTALAELEEGEVVLDLGSGGGIDVLLSGRRVGPSGKAFGLDMTDEMLALARRNAAEAGAENVEFLKGDIERIPLPDETVDVVISNCVINLATDKGQALREAFRVLRPGGRFAVSDIVVRGSLSARVRESLELWVGCVAGALEEEEYRRLLMEAGFEDPSLESTREYDPRDARAFLEGAGMTGGEVEDVVATSGRGVFSAFIRARKPA
jgi:ubiquinone/menaquinone biosynthesis C-methylase UbiE